MGEMNWIEGARYMAREDLADAFSLLSVLLQSSVPDWEKGKPYRGKIQTLRAKLVDRRRLRVSDRKAILELIQGLNRVMRATDTRRGAPHKNLWHYIQTGTAEARRLEAYNILPMWEGAMRWYSRNASDHYGTSNPILKRSIRVKRFPQGSTQGTVRRRIRSGARGGHYYLKNGRRVYVRKD